MLNFRHLLELDELAREDGKRYPKKRGLYSTIISEKGKHIIGIVGPRGVGKTIILKQMAVNRENAFYLSLDTIEEEDLFDAAKTLSERYGVSLLLLDEIHFQKEYEKKQRDVGYLMQDLNEEAKKAEAEAKGKFLKDLEGVLLDIAKKGNYDLILERISGGVLFASETSDITDQVIEAYNKEKP